MNRNTKRSGDESAVRGPGRPSLTDQRRAEIIDAFIHLIVRDGLDRVTLDDVARRAGVQRAAVRHYVGNRRDLIALAVEELTARYEERIRSVVGAEPTIDVLIDALFGSLWIAELVDVDSAFDVLVEEAARDESTRPLVRRAYDALLAEIEGALERSAPTSRLVDRRDTAYVIVCLAEHNVSMQQLGYPAARSAAARSAATLVVSDFSGRS